MRPTMGETMLFGPTCLILDQRCSAVSQYCSIANICEGPLVVPRRARSARRFVRSARCTRSPALPPTSCVSDLRAKPRLVMST
jgi:hypothetical protein